MRFAAAKETPATGVLQMCAASSARSSIAGSGAASSDLISLEGLEAQGFAACDVAFCQGAVIVPDLW